MGENVEVWIDLKKRQLESTEKSLTLENKNRKHFEFVLMIICIIAFVYTYPVTKLNSDSVIEIPAISLKVPLQAALIGFPTLITAIYLIFLNSAIRQSRLKIISFQINQSLKEVIDSFKIPKEEHYPIGYRLSFLLLPSPIQMSFHSNVTFAELGNFIVGFFVGIVFNSIPYITSIIITFKTKELLYNNFVFIWDIICVLIMLIAFISTLISFATYRKY